MGIISNNKKRLEIKYKSNPENFAYGQDKVWEDLGTEEKAASLFQKYGAKAKELAIETGKQTLNVGASFADVMTRTAPIESIRNIASGIKEAVNPTVEGESPISSFKAGVAKDQARPLLFEETSGKKVTNDDGSINWENARQFIGSAMEAPTYAYAAGTKIIKGGLLKRLLTRTVENVPVAGLMTGIQKFKEGTTEGSVRSMLINTLVLSGVSNIAGELRLPKQLRQEAIKKIEAATGKLSKEELSMVEGALKQGIDADEIIGNLKKVNEGTVTPEELTAVINKAGEESKYLLTEGKTPDGVQGEGFTMKEGVDNAALRKSKAIIAYQKEVAKYNKNPTPEQLKKVFETRKAKDELLKSVEPEVKAPQPKPTTSGQSSGGQGEKSKAIERIYQESIANEDFMFGKTTKDIEKNILKDGQLNPKLVQGRVNDVVQKLQREGIDATDYIDAMKGKTFKDYFSFDKANREAFAKMIPDGSLNEEGIAKTAKAAADVNKRIVAKGFEELPDEQLAQYNPTTREKAINDVAVALEDWEGAKKMALGQADSGNLPRQVLWNAVKNKAEQQGDIELMKKLAKSPIATERSLLAQQLGSAGFNNEPDGATNYIMDLMETRKKRVSERLGDINKTQSSMMKELDDSLKKNVIGKKDWTSFVDNIACKE